MGHKYFLVPEAGENSKTRGCQYELSLEVSSYFGSTCKPDTGALGVTASSQFRTMDRSTKDELQLEGVQCNSQIEFSTMDKCTKGVTASPFYSIVHVLHLIIQQMAIQTQVSSDTKTPKPKHKMSEVIINKNRRIVSLEMLKVKMWFGDKDLFS